MYTILLKSHAHFRNLVLIVLVLSIIFLIKDVLQKKSLGKRHTLIRLLSVITVHTQLLMGLTLFFVSPIIQNNLTNLSTIFSSHDNAFMTIFHPVLMIIAAVIITVGSARSKKQTNDNNSIKVLLKSSITTLFLILIAIPWYRIIR